MENILNLSFAKTFYLDISVNIKQTKKHLFELSFKPIIVEKYVLLSHGFTKHKKLDWYSIKDITVCPENGHVIVFGKLLKITNEFHHIQILYFGLYGENLKYTPLDF